MRPALAFVAALLFVAGCETSPIGGRCTGDRDCDRNTTGATAKCQPTNHSGATCPPNGQCVCCPSDPAMANMVTGCHINASTDVTPTDSSMDDVSSGDAPVVDVVTDAPMCSCAEGQFCDNTDGGLTCRPQRQLGAQCTAANQCGTNFCVDGVCCNSACSDAAHSCFASPDFAGICTAISTPADAGSDTGDTGVDGATDSGADVTDAGTDSGSMDARSDVAAD